MSKRAAVAVLLLGLNAAPLLAGDYSGQAALGGGLGGALGAYLGAELDGRSGALLGSALGAVAGTAIATDDHYRRPRERVIVREVRHYPVERHYYREHHHHRHDRFCPPGQWRKGRCY
jgi:hypothetical protein